MKTSRWTRGNRVELLENGEELYPRVFETIRTAREEVLLETFILADDEVGRPLQEALIEASSRGAWVAITLDGYGSSELSTEFIAKLTSHGVKVHLYDPARKLFGFRTNLFRRLHRKLIVIDRSLAFVGGINFCSSHLRAYSDESKQDYAVEVEGPVVDDIRFLMLASLPRSHRQRSTAHRVGSGKGGRAVIEPQRRARHCGTAEVMLVTRDNRFHRDDIERQYRLGARMARRQLIIANAYFFPSYRLLRAITRAARRGVEVQLLLQGQPDLAWVMRATSVLYRYLLRAGVRIFEYCERPFHGKVAMVDGEWSTIGSSNLDPLSLALNLEANLVIRDRRFAGCLQQRLEALLAAHCREVPSESVGQVTLWRQFVNLAIFHFLRHFPSWAGLLPGHTRRPALASVSAPVDTQEHHPDKP